MTLGLAIMREIKYVDIEDVKRVIKQNRLFVKTSDGQYTKGSYDTVDAILKDLDELESYTGGQALEKSCMHYADKLVGDLQMSIAIGNSWR